MTYANEVDKFGKLHKSKKIKPGNCIFPFKYKNINHNNCIEGKSGDWCATEINEKGTMQKFAYCKKNLKISNKLVKIKVNKKSKNIKKVKNSKN